MILEIVRAVRQEDSEVNVEWNYLTGAEGYVIDEEEKIINCIQSSIAAENSNQAPALAVNGPAHIGNLLYTHNVPVVVWGPRGGNAHSYDEFVEIDTIHKTSIVYARTILTYFGLLN
jgi:acetylornithine deacetylase/succinyl-diaminopimelate desuccinylase-like protein